MIDKGDILLLGPYIGDFEYEITIFRPLINWIHKNIQWPDTYISSHLNRNFLYDFIDGNHFISVYEFLSRDEANQDKLIHKTIQQKEFSSIVDKKIKDIIVKKEKCMKKNIHQFNTSYTKFLPPYSVYNKYFKRINFEKIDTKDIIFIPDMRENRKFSLNILNYLEENHPDDFLIIGDTKCWFKNKNWIQNNQIDYFETGYKLMIDHICNTKIVITPCSHWTFLSNLQGTYVFSWTTENKNISIYKNNGLYGFGNKNMVINTTEENILNQLKYTIKGVLNGTL